MFRYRFSLLCPLGSVELAFRRALGAQSILLDLVPFKKPLVDGSLSWFVDENIEIVLVSGVKGTSPNEVTDSVKRRAVHLLQRCGDGDALKGSRSLKSCIEEAATVRRLLRSLDIQVRLRFWSQSSTDTPTLSGEKVERTAVAGGAPGPASVIQCSVYETDAWEPRPQERHLSDVTLSSSSSSSPSPAMSLDHLLSEALLVVRRDAERKVRQLAMALQREASLLLSANTGVGPAASVVTETRGGGNNNNSTTGVSAAKSAVQILTEEPAMRWIVSTVSYTADLKFLRCRGLDASENGVIAGLCVLCDDVGNTECCSVPLVALKDKGLVHYGALRKTQQKPLEEAIVEKLDDDDDAEVVPMNRIEGGMEHTSNVVRLIWAQPLLQTRLHRASTDNFCGSLTSTRAEDFVGSCGRLDIDAWLSEQGRPTTVPMMPRYLQHFDPATFLRECLPLELGSRVLIYASVGSLQLGYHVAITSSGRVVTPTSCFSSALAAVSILLPWYVAMPLRPTLPEQKQQQHEKKNATMEAVGPTGNGEISAADPENSDSNAAFVVRVIDMEASLKKLGVVRGSFKSDTLEYCSAENRILFRFEQMDTLHGIGRLVKRVRQSPGACFTSVSVMDNLRAPLFVAWRALGGVTPNKKPPFVKRIRFPVPLVPGEFFSLRFSHLCEMEQREQSLLYIFEQHAEDPAQWPLRPRFPCFLNRWRLTRGIIAAITHHDPSFTYTLERMPVTDDDGAEARLLLRFFSGGDLMEETPLHEAKLLLGVRNCFAKYATRWSVEVPSIDDVSFGFLDIKRSISPSHRAFVSSFLQRSEICTRRGDEMLLELQILPNLKIVLVTAKHAHCSDTREQLCKTFLTEQFPTLLPMVDALGRARHLLSLHHHGGDLMFRCYQDNDSKSLSCSFRWVLQTQGEAGSTTMDLDAAEGESRFGVFLNLLDKLGSKSALTPEVETAALVPCTIEEYQGALARERGVQRIVHEYDPNQKALVVKGFGCSVDTRTAVATTATTTTTTTTTVVIRVMPLMNGQNIGDVLHRYYRKELRLPDPPLPMSEEKLRKMSLELIYKSCGQHFSQPLPPLKTALVVEQRQRDWLVILRIPAMMFLLNAPEHIEYLYNGRGKHEGKREVVCNFYRSLHGETPEALAQMLLKVVCTNPPLNDAGGRVAGCNKNRGVEVVSCRTSGSMYDELLQLVGARLHSHVGYDGVVECRLSFINGINCRYLRRPPKAREWVELFHVPILSASWLPLQLLVQLMLCARRIIPEEELQTILLGSAAEWPSLFLDSTRNERLFCTTFLRRYWGLWTYEEDDVEERATLPGTIYLVERTRCVGDRQFEASLSLVQTPWPPNTATFMKVLASHRSSSATRAGLGMWGYVSCQLSQLQPSMQEAQEGVDRAFIAAIVGRCKENDDGR